MDHAPEREADDSMPISLEHTQWYSGCPAHRKALDVYKRQPGTLSDFSVNLVVLRYFDGLTDKYLGDRFPLRKRHINCALIELFEYVF